MGITPLHDRILVTRVEAPTVGNGKVTDAHEGANVMTTMSTPHVHVEAPPLLARVLTRVAKTGIYLVRGVPRELQCAARVRAAGEGTTLSAVLVDALREYASGTWTPQRDTTSTAGTTAAP